jgi:hypothetical protein
MSPSTSARRLPALAVVAGGHALALWWFLALTRTQAIPGAPDASALVLLLLPEQGSQSGIAPRPERTRQPRPPALPLEPARPPGSAAPAPGAPSTAIDWPAEAAGAASRWVAQDEAKGRKARAFGVPPASAMFAPAPAVTCSSTCTMRAIRRGPCPRVSSSPQRVLQVPPAIEAKPVRCPQA